MDPRAVASTSSRRSSRRKEISAAAPSSSSSRSSTSTVRSSSISSGSSTGVSSMTAPPPIQRSGCGNFSGGGASGFSSVAAPPIQHQGLLRRSMEAAAATAHERADAGQRAQRQRAAADPLAAASASLNLKKKKHADSSRKTATTTTGGMSVSDAESSQIGYGYGDCADYYQLPLYDSDSHYDEDDDNEGEGTNNENELTASAYFHNQQSATIGNKSKRRRPSKSSKIPKSKPTVRWCDSNRSFLSRDRFVKKYLSDSLLLSNSSILSSNSNNSTTSSFRRRVSFSSSSSSASSFRLNRHAHASHAQAMLPVSSCYVPLPKNATRAAELENDILLSSSASNSSLLEDAALVDMARASKKKIESVAKRQVMVGKWKQRYVGNISGSHYQGPRHRNGLEKSASDSQVYEYLTSAKDQYSVVAKINLPCSLLEIQSVLMAQGGSGGGGTSRSTEFHRSMVMLFGDQYVYGLNVRSIDCAPYTRRSSSASTATGMGRRGSRASTRSSSSHNQNTNHQSQPPSTRLAINAVSLLMKHRLVWKQQNMSFLDYCDEKPHAKTVTRVLQTLDTMEEEDQEDDESNHQDGDVYQQIKRRQSSPLQLHESRSHVRGLRGLLAGYVLQEDSEEKFTRLFFYATHKSPTVGKFKKPKRVTAWSVQLLREMVSKLCTLETVVLRRRLGFYPIMDVPSRSPRNNSHYHITRHSNSSSNNSTSSDVALLQNAAASCCSSCYVPFNALLFRRKHFCHLCGHYTCRKCSRVEPIEKILGLIDHRRVCVSCVRRVNYCVFNMDGAFYSQQQEQQQLYQQQLQHQKGKAMMMMMLSSDGKKLSDVPEEEFPPLLGEDDDDLASTIIEDLALFPDEHLENDLASEKVATYLKKMFERSVGGGYQRQKSRSPLNQQQQHNRPETRAERTAEIGDDYDDAGATAETTGTTPKESICLLDSARSSIENGGANYTAAQFA